MPAGVPVAAMAIDKPGRSMRRFTRRRFWRSSDAQIAKRLETYKEELAQSVLEKSARVKQQFAGKTA